MKFSTKIFVFTYCILVLAMGFGSFILLDSIYKAEVEDITDKAESDNKALFSYVVSVYEMSGEIYSRYSINSFAEQMSDEETGNSTFFGEKSELIKAGWEYIGQIDDLENGQVISEIIENNEGTFAQVISRYKNFYMINRYSLQEAVQSREQNFDMYRIVLVGISAVMAVILYLFAKQITKPLARLTRVAGKVSGGNYSVRVNTDLKKMKSREVKQMGDVLNSLTINIDNHINELNDMIEKRETFMADFTHEIKTPLTSIIGYGDILRTFEVSPEKRREYGDYIYREGKRLEQLSLNLLQIIVMDKKELEKVQINTVDIISRMEKGSHFLGEKYGVTISFETDKTTIEVEPSLYITAVMNFIDNACKASEKGMKVTVMGKVENGKYTVYVKDSGSGIPKDQLDKITEPFYMVDKSRARKLGGAGLGLSLCKKVAELHGGNIGIQSEEGKGTTVSIMIDEVNADTVTDNNGEMENGNGK